MTGAPTLLPQVGELRAALAGTVWRDVRVVASTPSTNADVMAAAQAGEHEGLVEVAEFQSAGRGRLDRTWTAPPGSALMFSALLRPEMPAGRWSWLPLLMGVAAASAVGEVTGVAIGLKWPNDMLAGDRKLAGMLAERTGGAAALGIGVNVTQHAAELPSPAATSLLLQGAGTIDRVPLLLAVLRSLGAWYERWHAAGGDAEACGLAEAYRARCVTLGREVRVELPSGNAVAGTATGVAVDGSLVIRDRDGVPHPLPAGDVVHLR